MAGITTQWAINNLQVGRLNQVFLFTVKPNLKRTYLANATTCQIAILHYFLHQHCIVRINNELKIYVDYIRTYAFQNKLIRLQKKEIIKRIWYFCVGLFSSNTYSVMAQRKNKQSYGSVGWVEYEHTHAHIQNAQTMHC